MTQSGLDIPNEVAKFKRAEEKAKNKKKNFASLKKEFMSSVDSIVWDIESAFDECTAKLFEELKLTGLDDVPREMREAAMDVKFKSEAGYELASKIERWADLIDAMLDNMFQEG